MSHQSSAEEHGFSVTQKQGISLTLKQEPLKPSSQSNARLVGSKVLRSGEAFLVRRVEGLHSNSFTGMKI